MDLDSELQQPTCLLMAQRLLLLLIPSKPHQLRPLPHQHPQKKVVSGFVVPSVGSYADLVKPAPAGPMYHVAAPIAPSVLASTPVVAQEVSYAVPQAAPIPYYLNPTAAAPPAVTPAVVPYAADYGYAKVQAVPSPPLTTQHHAQSEFGEYNYGYSNPTSSKNEIKTIDGVTRGSYSYVDANGIVQRVDYISDDIYGFRVAATNLPVAPAAAPVPVPVASPEESSAVVIEE